jgi:hypothetical protein
MVSEVHKRALKYFFTIIGSTVLVVLLAMGATKYPNLIIPLLLPLFILAFMAFVWQICLGMARHR